MHHRRSDISKVVLLLAACMATTGLRASAQPPATRPAGLDGDTIRCRPREEVTLALPVDGADRKATPFSLAIVRKDGRLIEPPANMTLDAATGRFSWLPTESQAGTYVLRFLVRNLAGDRHRHERRIIVQPREVATGAGKIARLLRRWVRAGTGAGNTGDFYDNRDGGHSRLRTEQFGQLDKVVYTPLQKRRKLHWGLQVRQMYPHVTLGNSSTASAAVKWGSNARRAMLSNVWMGALYRQYTASHLYVYPEHRDHDPGHNGRGGYGDLFPANTPYVIVSQGSSGSDQAFLRAVTQTLAAFRPDVKKRLIETGLLMPTVQMILRSSGRQLRGRDGYLAGRAHPTVFDRRNLDPLRMIRMAHGITADALPPMIQLKVLAEGRAVAGRDYFDVHRSEKLFDTPAAIARIGRSLRRTRRMVVSAEGSFDANRRPLKFHWVVLRGDPERVRIRPLNPNASRVELLVSYQRRRPVTPGDKLESNRVDIGAFVHNGRHYSAPGFVCFYWLDDEARTYDDDGRIVEVHYGAAETTLGYPSTDILNPSRGYDVTGWAGLLSAATGDGDRLATALLRRQLTGPTRLVLHRAAREFRAASKPIPAAEAELREAEADRQAAAAELRRLKQDHGDAKRTLARTHTDAARAAVDALAGNVKKAEKALSAANRRRGEATRKLRTARRPATGILTRAQPRLANKASVKQVIERALNAIKDDPGFYVRNAAVLDRLADAGDAIHKDAFGAERRRLVTLGILKNDGGRWRRVSAVFGPQADAGRLTAFERNQLERFHLAVLQHALYPGMIRREIKRNFVNPVLATPKSWRDVYRYDAAGRLIGWTRHDHNGRRDFTADGAVVLKADRLGRALEARTVRYVVDRKSSQLVEFPGREILHYRYDSDADRVGRVEKRRTAGR